MLKKWGLVGTITISAMLLGACGGESSTNVDAKSSNDGEKKVLEMATSADFPPFESRDVEGNFEG
ncbi:MAG: ABC transporter substrate-binding protein, partial [Paenisporosarcina sp.]|nr:ABC transporter substrate-binding protein [Paenisporosarcina sp.]